MNNRPAIFDLTSAVNEPTAVAVDFACATRESASAVVVFHAASGRTYRLVVVLSYIGYLVYKHCFQHGCPSSR